MSVSPFKEIIEYFANKFGSLPEQLSELFSDTATRVVFSLFLAVLAIALVFAVVAALFNAVLWIASTWRMFRAAGEGGWKCLIPFYNQYILYKITWSKTAFWAVLILSLGLGLLNGIAGALSAVAFRSSIAAFFKSAFDFGQASVQVGVNTGSVVAVAILYVFVILVGGTLLVLDVISRWHLAKAFNHGFWYFAGLIVFPKIFYYVIGLDSGITYIGNAAARKEKKAAKRTASPAPDMIVEAEIPAEPAPVIAPEAAPFEEHIAENAEAAAEEIRPEVPEALPDAPADPQDTDGAFTPEDAPKDPENP